VSRSILETVNKHQAVLGRMRSRIVKVVRLELMVLFRFALSRASSSRPPDRRLSRRQCEGGFCETGQRPHFGILRNRILEIAFQSRPLRTICEDETHARSELGSDIVEILKHRLADLRAASTGKDILAGRPRILGDSGGECMAVDLVGAWRLVFAANHVRNPRTHTATCDWAKVTRVKIMRIENCDA
jgi:proteic killer suppression protein